MSKQTYLIKNALWKLEAESAEEAKNKAINILRNHAHDFISAEKAQPKKKFSIFKCFLFGH